MKVFSFSFIVPVAEVGWFIINNFNMELSQEIKSKTGQRLLATIMAFSHLLTLTPNRQKLQRPNLT